MGIRVETNKTLALLYSLLNHFDQAGGDPETHPLREVVKKHFEDYKGKEPNVEEYIHEHKVVVWSLTVGEPPRFKERDIKITEDLQWHVDKGAIIKPYLKEFYENTDFENFYPRIEKGLLRIKGEMEEILSENDVEKLLEDTWGIKLKHDMVVIPNPFTWGSFGPQIGDTNYQVVGVMGKVNKRSLLHTLVHEGSHPIAKQILKPYRKKIEEKAYLLERVQEHPKYPNSYNIWQTCFEEHFIRAVHMGFISPQIIEDYSIEKGLQWEKDRKGMVLIDTFYENLQKDDISGSVEKILNALE